eukprot:CAMPEP_0177492848 /NCGR_PEP_ID=MMETSP0369-20130122/32576_1 /TAXON_ID=447022 ORGANISM="Scrippsiella hangoei-like, Strain SHHI-4" /NCGR_SAMPLE_ID=MMETSP0369 /ASSEMBLY_ACC=CAM_ASM_000364 /LENGTH=241 /DNA_ID=CAMNT_0018969647 /DNA_START=27 /DNA_END=748 /DNA_ORIENTATION=+
MSQVRATIGSADDPHGSLSAAGKRRPRCNLTSPTAQRTERGRGQRRGERPGAAAAAAAARERGRGRPAAEARARGRGAQRGGRGGRTSAAEADRGPRRPSVVAAADGPQAVQPHLQPRRRRRVVVEGAAKGGGEAHDNESLGVDSREDLRGAPVVLRARSRASDGDPIPEGRRPEAAVRHRVLRPRPDRPDCRPVVDELRLLDEGRAPVAEVVARVPAIGLHHCARPARCPHSTGQTANGG